DSDKIMLDALTDVEKHYSVDRDRIVLTGIDSGGKGAWVLAARHPEIFSAVVPMAGFAAPDVVPQLTNMPIWAFHNDGDFITGSGNTKTMVQQIEAAGGHPKVTIYAEGGQDCWDQAYSEGELFQWMMAQRRAGAATPVNSAAAIAQGSSGPQASTAPAEQAPPKPVRSRAGLFSQNWALVIGISSYRDSRIPLIAQAAGDARQFHKWLLSPNGGHYGAEHVKLLIDGEASRQAILDALNTFLSGTIAEDTVTIYVCAHGAVSPESPEKVYLLPADIDANHLDSTALSLADIETALKQSIKAHKV